MLPPAVGTMADLGACCATTSALLDALSVEMILWAMMIDQVVAHLAAFSTGMLSMSLAVTLFASFSAGCSVAGARSCSLRSMRGCAGAGAARSLTLAYSSDICADVIQTCG